MATACEDRTEADKKAHCRGQLSATLRRNGFNVAADAVDGDEMPAREAQVALREALRAGGAERWDRVGWAICCQYEARTNMEAEGQVLFFLKWVLQFFTIIAYGEKVGKEDLAGAERALKESRPSEKWANWALRALGRLISAPAENAVNALFRKDAELRQKCSTPVAFVDHVREQIRLGIIRHRAAIVLRMADKKKAKADHQARLAERGIKRKR